MRAVVQRVNRATVIVDDATVGAIERGLLVFVGIAEGDTDADAEYIAAKISEMRIFEDADGKQNLSVLDIAGGILVVSQFTLLGDLRKGRRPSYSEAAAPDTAKALYESVVERLRNRNRMVQTGVFRAHMHVSLVNDGPVTLLLDSRRTF